jgi:hypothetical protein
MSESDLLLVIDCSADLSVFLPSKLIEYVGAGIPICGIVPPGTSANLLRRLGGLAADPRNTEEIAKTLMKSLRLARERRVQSALPPWGDPEVRAEFAVEHVASDFEAILADAVQ